MSMRLPKRALILGLLVGASPPASAQAPSPSPSGAKSPPPPLSTPTPTVDGHVITFEVQAQLPGVVKADKVTPEVVAILGHFQSQSKVVSRVFLGQDHARQEIVSPDYALPEGTVLLHKAGDRFFAVADPKAKTYAVMDADTLLKALEGGIGIENSQYAAKARHTTEKKVVAGLECRKSLVTVTYVSSIPFETERVLVQQKNEIEVWHTSEVAAPVAFDHFFLRYQQDRTGIVQKVFAAEIGFPAEVRMTVSLASLGGGKAPKAPPGTIHMLVTEVRKEKKMDVELFRIPPAGYRKTDRLPAKN